jgi:hypothetical protein
MDSETQETVLLAFEIARYCQSFYNKKPGGCEYKGYDHFGDGPNTSYSQTRDRFLIIEGNYGTLASKIHTPLGYWYIVSGGMGSGNEFKIASDMLLADTHLKLELIRPGYQNQIGYWGPWYLVTEFNGKKVLNDDYCLPPFEGDKDRDYDANDSDFNSIFKPRTQLLNSLYRKRDEFFSYVEARRLYECALQVAFERQMWKESTGILERAKKCITLEECEGVLMEFKKLATNWTYGDAMVKKLAKGLISDKKTGYYHDLLVLICYCGTYSPE